MNEDTTRMLKAARKHNVTFAAIRLDLYLKAQLSAWYHLNAEMHLTNNNPSKCLIHKHQTKTVADLLQISAHLRPQDQENPHQPTNYCRC
jgi:hypothetical protein